MCDRADSAEFVFEEGAEVFGSGVVGIECFAAESAEEDGVVVYDVALAGAQVTDPEWRSGEVKPSCVSSPWRVGQP